MAGERHRSRGSISEPEEYRVTYVKPATGDSFYPDNVQLLSKEFFSESTTDVEIPNWRGKIQNGEVVTNPFSNTKVTSIYSRDYRRNYYGPALNPDGSTNVLSGYDISGVSSMQSFKLLPDYTLEPYVNVENLKAQAILGMVQRAKLQQSQALVTLFEMNKTIKTIETNLARLIRFVRKGFNLKKLAARGKIGSVELAAAWLELTYGVQPIYFDIRDAMRAFQSEQREKPPRIRADYVVDQVVDSETVVPMTAGSSQSYDLRTVTTRTVEVTAGGYFVVTPDAAAQRAAIWGLDAPFSTIWELIPFSFVVDMAISVGDWLAALEPSVGIARLTSWVTVRDVLHQTSIIENARPNPNYDHSRARIVILNGTANGVRIKTDREVEPPMPVFPPVNVKLNVKNAATLVSLLRSINQGLSDRLRV